MNIKNILIVSIPLILGLFFLKINKDLLATYLKEGYVPVSKFEERIQKVPNEIVLGFWLDPDKILAARKFSDGYYLIQRDPAATYVVGRGKNLLSDTRTVIKNKSFKTATLKSLDSELGGLFEPDNFPIQEMEKSGFRRNENGEWILPSKSSTVAVLPSSENGFIKYSLPKAINTTDWSSFQNLKVPEGITNVGGFGFPVYRNEQLQNGKVNLLEKGFTNIWGLSAFPKSASSPANNYYFSHLHYMIKIAARGMVKAGKNGGIYGNIKAIADLQNDDTNIPYYGVKVEGAKELGRYLFASYCCTNSSDSQNWSIPLNESVIMIDEENMHSYNWEGGDSYSFYGYLNQGMMEGAGGKYRIFWYAQPVSRWFHSQVVKGVDTLTEKDIEDAFSEKNILMNSPGWLNSTWFTDANGGYSKVPYLSNTNIYLKVNGVIAKDRKGKRKFRDGDFSLNIYKSKESILSTPNESIRYWLGNPNTGEQKFGRQYVDVHSDGSASIKKEYSKQGLEWHWNGGSRPYPQYWEPETKLWLDGIYRRADGIMYDLLMLAKLEKGKYDITKANTKFKLYGEQRPKTEPWTFGGNSVEVREVGESQIFYDTFMLLLSGGQATSTWDDGFWRGDLPDKGKPLFDKDDYWGRYHSKLAAIQTVLKPLEGSKSTDWTYIHFYYPFWGAKNSEVISSGIYFKGKLHVFFLNPTLENGEKQSLTLEAGGVKHAIELVGHEVYFKSFEVPANLRPVDFKLSYTTIYDRKVKVNGIVTDKIAQHYE